jgi:hypothetical protein
MFQRRLLSFENCAELHGFPGRKQGAKPFALTKRECANKGLRKGTSIQQLELRGSPRGTTCLTEV